MPPTQLPLAHPAGTEQVLPFAPLSWQLPPVHQNADDAQSVSRVHDVLHAVLPHA